MPFENKTVMGQKIEFVLLAESVKRVNFSNLCNRFRISRKTGYKWFNRYKEGGIKELQDKSRRPHHSPRKYREEIENYVIKLRGKEMVWGPKKLRRILLNRNKKGIYPFEIIPSRNTIGRMIRRNGLTDPVLSEQSKPCQHFEWESPNDLWQIDFKGYFSMQNKNSCHPLVILDDHSRFNIGLYACENQQHDTVKMHLIEVFEKYGLPERILSDNGSPWGTNKQEIAYTFRAFSELEKWMIRLNVKPIHGRPYHPQTQGKEERFNKTFKLEVLRRNNFRDIDHCQNYFDNWREKYNCIRPHESLNLDVPANHYYPSRRSYPSVLPPVEYDDSFIVRKVMNKGVISFKGMEYKVGSGLIGDYVGIRPASRNGDYEVYFCNQLIRTIKK